MLLVLHLCVARVWGDEGEVPKINLTKNIFFYKIAALGLPKHLGYIEVRALKRDLLNNIKQPVLQTALEATAGNLIPQHNVVTAYQVFTTYVLPDMGIGIAFVPGTVEIKGIYEIQ